MKLVRGASTFGVVAALLVAAVTVQAGFITGEFSVSIEGDGTSFEFDVPGWLVEPIDIDGTLAPRLRLTEFVGTYGRWTVSISGETDEDPVMNVTKDVENSSDFAWTGYEVFLSGTNVEFVDGSATSTHFGSVAMGTDWITYSGAPYVNPGETLTIGFDILVASTGGFTYSLVQSPVPEPGTMLLVGAGLVALIRRR
jgi:hypothetical protein